MTTTPETTDYAQTIIKAGPEGPIATVVLSSGHSVTYPMVDESPKRVLSLWLLRGLAVREGVERTEWVDLMDGTPLIYKATATPDGRHTLTAAALR